MATLFLNYLQLLAACRKHKLQPFTCGKFLGSFAQNYDMHVRKYCYYRTATDGYLFVKKYPNQNEITNLVKQRPKYITKEPNEINP